MEKREEKEHENSEDEEMSDEVNLPSDDENKGLKAANEESIILKNTLSEV